MKNLIIIFLTFTLSNTILFAQKYGETPEDSIECIKNMSLWKEFYKQKSLDDALAPWSICMKTCPQSSINMYANGDNIIKFQISKYAKLKDYKTAQAYIDTLMLVYDQWVENFGHNPRYPQYGEGYIRGRQALDLNKLKPNDYETAFNLFKTSVELEGNKSKPDVLNKYFEISKEMLKIGKISKETFVDTYDMIGSVIESYLNNPKGDSNDYNIFKTLESNTWIRVSDTINCTDLINIYGSKFESMSDDIKFLKKITKMLDQTECTESDLFFKATEKLHSIEPSASSAYLMANMHLAKKNYNEAIKYYKQAIEFETSDRAKAKYYLKMGYAQIGIGQYSQAKASAQKCISIRSDWGMGYLLLGDTYGAGASQCNEGEGETAEFSKKTGYWAAVDQFEKAKRIDSSIDKIASEKIRSYKKLFPGTEILFFQNLKNGDTFKVGCWINETTTVRSSD